MFGSVLGHMHKHEFYVFLSLIFAPSQTQAQGEKRKVCWTDSHASYCIAHDDLPNWWESCIPGQDMQTLFPTLRAFSAREFEVLRLSHGVVGPEPPHKMRLINTTPSLGRSNGACSSNGTCRTITTGTRLYITSRCRIVLGEELFALQGIHYGTDLNKALNTFPQSFLADLAGNAFHAWCCSAAYHAVIRLLSTAWRRQQQRVKPEAPCSHDVGGIDGSESDMDDFMNSVWGLFKHLGVVVVASSRLISQYLQLLTGSQACPKTRVNI